MAHVTNIVVEEFGPCKIVGKPQKMRDMQQEIPRFWQTCFDDGSFDALREMKGYIPNELSDCYAGYMAGFDEIDLSFLYVAGIFMDASFIPPAGYASNEIPKSTVAKLQITGTEAELLAEAHPIALAAVKDAGKMADWFHFYECEVYTDARYFSPRKQGETILTIDYYLPVMEMPTPPERHSIVRKR